MAYRVAKGKAPAFPRRLHDSPHPIARFNQHVVLYKLFPEHQSKYGAGFPINTKVVRDNLDSEEEDSAPTEPGHPEGTREDDGGHSLPPNEPRSSQQDQVAPVAKLGGLPMAHTGKTGNGPVNINDTSTIPPDDNLATAQSGEMRKERSGTNDVLNPESDGDGIGSCGEESMELEYPIRSSSVLTVSWLPSSPPTLSGGKYLRGSSALPRDWNDDEIVVPDSHDKRQRERLPGELERSIEQRLRGKISQPALRELLAMLSR